MKSPLFSTFSLILPNAGRLIFLFLLGLKGILSFYDEDTFGSKRNYIYIRLIYIKIQPSGRFLTESAAICQQKLINEILDCLLNRSSSP